MDGKFVEWFMDGGHVIFGLAVTLISTGIHFALLKERSWRLGAELLLMYSMGVSGFRSIFGGFIMHYFFADEMARSIGWPAGNPFQTEVAFFNLAVGILGVLTFSRKDFWLPYIIVSAVMGWGAGFVHLMDIFEHGNFAGNNAGPILYADFLIPILRISLYMIYRKSKPITPEYISVKAFPSK
jgi:hypothetical protein